MAKKKRRSSPAQRLYQPTGAIRPHYDMLLARAEDHLRAGREHRREQARNGGPGSLKAAAKTVQREETTSQAKVLADVKALRDKALADARVQELAQADDAALMATTMNGVPEELYEESAQGVRFGVGSEIRRPAGSIHSRSSPSPGLLEARDGVASAAAAAQRRAYSSLDRATGALKGRLNDAGVPDAVRDLAGRARSRVAGGMADALDTTEAFFVAKADERAARKADQRASKADQRAPRATKADQRAPQSRVVHAAEPRQNMTSTMERSINSVKGKEPGGLIRVAAGLSALNF